MITNSWVAYKGDETMKPECKLIGEDGNIFNLCGIARRVLKREKMYDEADEMADRVVKAESYDDALSIIGEYVNIC